MTATESLNHQGALSMDALALKPLPEWYGSIVDVPVDLIKPDSDNLRQEFDADDLMDLGRNIQAIGQLDEITLFPIMIGDDLWGGSFDLHDGERRWRAAVSVGLPTLRAKIVSRPSDEEVMFKKVSRVLQTRSLSPATKVAGLEKALHDLGVLDTPASWGSYREKLGGGQEWPQLVRVLLLSPKVRSLLDNGQINFTIAQSIGRLPSDSQESIAEFVVVNKLNGRFLATQMIPYLLSYPDASPAQAFEQARVGNWKHPTKTPYAKGLEPSLDERIEDFLSDCVKWERSWEVLVRIGLVHDIAGNPVYEYRVKDAARRISERAGALAERIARGQPNAITHQLNEGEGDGGVVPVAEVLADD